MAEHRLQWLRVMLQLARRRVGRLEALLGGDLSLSHSHSLSVTPSAAADVSMAVREGRGGMVRTSAVKLLIERQLRGMGEKEDEEELQELQEQQHHGGATQTGGTASQGWGSNSNHREIAEVRAVGCVTRVCKVVDSWVLCIAKFLLSTRNSPSDDYSIKIFYESTHPASQPAIHCSVRLNILSSLCQDPAFSTFACKYIRRRTVLIS